MFKLEFSKSIYTESYYYSTIDSGFESLATIPGAKFVSLSYAYKRLGMYWTLDPCYHCSNGKYLTFKQLSKLQLTKQD